VLPGRLLGLLQKAYIGFNGARVKKGDQKMLKKSLFAVALVAILAGSAVAGELKVHGWAVTCEYTKQALDEINVYLKMPYYIKIEQPSTIQLVQMTGSIDDWEGYAKLANGNKPKAVANFAAALSVTIALTADGIILAPSATTATIAPTPLVPLQITEMTITATLMNVDLDKLAVCTNYHVATVTVWVMPSTPPSCTPICP
jgi:hypothetical protein